MTIAQPPSMTGTIGARRGGWRTSMLLWGGAIVGAIALGRYAHPPMAMGPGGVRGRALPRVPGPPPDVPTLLYLLGVGSVVWYAVVLSLPVMLWSARRLHADRWGRGRTIALIAGVVATLVVATIVAQYGIVYGGAPVRPSFAGFFPEGLRQNLLPWVAATGIVAAIEARRRAQQSALERERLRAQVAEQRLIALTGQLHPHFLFNTLQSISTLIHRDKDAADEMLAKLSDLLRDLLRHRDSVLVPLGDEVRYARTYLEIAKLRFADRLTFTLDVPPQLFDLEVPLFILQPLVENALAHGVGGRMRGGSVALRAWRRDGILTLEVTDDGAGLPAQRKDGVGLSNTRERLRATFGDDQRLSIESPAEGGVVARIAIPARPHSRTNGRA
jgi:hypothetical protein